MRCYLLFFSILLTDLWQRVHCLLLKGSPSYWLSKWPLRNLRVPCQNPLYSYWLTLDREIYPACFSCPLKLINLNYLPVFCFKNCFHAKDFYISRERVCAMILFVLLNFLTVLLQRVHCLLFKGSPSYWTDSLSKWPLWNLRVPCQDLLYIFIGRYWISNMPIKKYMPVFSFQNCFHA